MAFVEFRDKALVPDHRPKLIPVLAWFFRLLWAVLGDEEMALLLKPHSFVHWDDPDADIHPRISQKNINDVCTGVLLHCVLPFSILFPALISAVEGESYITRAIFWVPFIKTCRIISKTNFSIWWNLKLEIFTGQKGFEDFLFFKTTAFLIKPL